MTAPKARVTIKDVARRAGVSVATVSKVINSRYGVAEDTGARVRAVIDELGYETSLVAQSLRSRRTSVIAILAYDLEPFSTQLLKGAAEALHDSGYELVVYSAGGLARDPEGWERRYLSRVAGTLADGVILITPSTVGPHAGAPVVAVDPHTGLAVPTVDSDNLNGAKLATNHLIGLGHRRIGFIAGRSELESARLREEGYRQAIEAAGIEFDPGLVAMGEYRCDASVHPALRLLQLPDRPTAIFAANDLSAIGVMRAAASMGLEVPKDLSVVGFDNIPESALTTPPLTTIDQFIHRLGYRAIRMLLSLIEGKSRVETRITLPTELVVRQTTAPPPARP